MNKPATQWRTLPSLAERECETCGHARMQRLVAIEHRLCGEPAVLQAIGRAVVAAGLARDEACAGRQWRAQ